NQTGGALEHIGPSVIGGPGEGEIIATLRERYLQRLDDRFDGGRVVDFQWIHHGGADDGGIGKGSGKVGADGDGGHGLAAIEQVAQIGKGNHAAIDDVNGRGSGDEMHADGQRVG